MSTTRQITLTENPDGRWTAYDTATHTVTEGPTRDEALENLDNALGEVSPGTGAQTDERPPAAPLYDLIGLVDEDDGDRLRERSRAFREEFDERVDQTRRDLSEEE
jgi:predicted RNase H-like HicB family nuclease